MNINSAKCLTYASLVGLLSLSAVATAYAEDISTKPDGYHVVPSQNSPGTATFSAKVDRTAQTIEYELSWNNLQGDIIQSHIHFGRPASNGDIVLFLCGDATHKPNPPAVTVDCINPGGDPRNGSAKGTLAASDIVALPFGGIQPGQQLLPFKDFEELVTAIDAGATYVVVHTKGEPDPGQHGQPSGELRGNVENTQNQPIAGLGANNAVGGQAQPAAAKPGNRL